ncbi:MAG TPA: hypothetical protein VFZ97_15805 [Acidimicrobiales bacterium]
MATLLTLSIGAALTRTVIDPVQRSAHGASMHGTAHQTNLAQSPDMLSTRLALSHMPAGSPTVRYSGARSVGEGIRTGGNGFWAAYPNGTVVADSPAPVLGDMTGTQLTRPIVGSALTPSSNGYWLVASDGGVFTFGDAGFFGSTGAERLNQPVVGMASTPDGRGYWLVASDGGVFTFGDAGFFGSTGAERLNQPVVGMASTPDGRGYWLVASDGGIFTFGDAGFYGSTGAQRLNQPVSGMATTPDSHGYWLVARDGGVFTFGDAQFHGSAANNFPANGQHAVGITSAGNGGYWLATDTGSVASMDAPLTASSTGSGPPGSSQLPPNQDPARSMPPSGDFYSACFSNSYSASACDKSALSNIDSALSGEGYGPLSLPSNYGSLSTIAQLVAVANAERAVRGLPQMPENSNLDSMAYNGARNNTDPTGPAGYTWGSNLAMGYPTALSADYVWMYDDGANSPNVDCQSAGDPGCWGHRHNVLIQGGGESGGGLYNDNGTLNLTQLFVVNYR